MTILFMGGEMGAFIPADSSATETTSGLPVYDSNFSRCSLKAGSGSYNESATWTGQADLFVHARLGSETFPSGAVTILSLHDGTTDAIKLEYDRGAQTLTAKYWNGTTYVTIDAAITIDMTSTAHDVDVHAVVNSASGSCDVYIAGTRRIHGTGLALSGTTSIVKVRQYGANFSPQLSQCVVSTTSTIGGKLFTVPVNGAGATSSWTGTYANIDETVYSDLDFINSGTANQVSTFSVNAPTLTGYVVQAVAVTARANRGSGGPQNLKLVLRSGGTDYLGSSKSLDVGYGAFVEIWETDPATSAAWVNTAIATLQPGVKSIA
jgi:hypothetical protein